MARDSQAALVALNRFGFGARGGASGDFINAASDPRGFVKAELSRPAGALLEVPGLLSTPALASAVYAYQDEIKQARDAKPAAGAPQATMFVFGGKYPAHHAAWVNGGMSHARDYDDTHDGAILHAGVTAVPAAIAAGQLRGRLSGADLIAAVAAGLEVTCRLGVAVKVDIIESGFIYTSLLGWMPGGLAITTAVGCAIFTWAGSGVTILSMGGLLLPMLVKARYPERFSIGLINGSGSLGLLFPPSLPVILYGIYSQTAISTLFVAQMRQDMHFAYLQDDIRANDRLTFNAGLRYEYATPMWEASNRLTNFDPTTRTILTASDGSMADRPPP